MKIDVEILAAEFNERHNFNSGEIELLRRNFPKVIIDNIPEAWVLPIDSFLHITSNMKRLEQHWGFIVPTWIEPPSEKDKKNFKELEEELYAIDGDLHQLLELEEK